MNNIKQLGKAIKVLAEANYQLGKLDYQYPEVRAARMEFVQKSLIKLAVILTQKEKEIRDAEN